MATLEQLAFRTRRHVPDATDEGDTTSRRESSVTAAFQEFSRDVPLVVAAEMIDARVPASEIDGWDARWSKPVSAGWPALSRQSANLRDEPVEVLVEVDQSTQEERVVCPDAFPDSGSPILLRFTARWTAATLAEAHEDPVVLLASSLYARALAGVKQDRQRVLPGGAVEFSTEEEVRRYLDLAESLYVAYRTAAGLTVALVGRSQGKSAAAVKENA